MLLSPVSSVAPVRLRKSFVESPDGVRTSFTAPQKFIAAGDLAEMVFHNGDLMEPGATCDYVASESGGAGTGFDTVTFNFVPTAKDRLGILIMPSGL